MLGHEQHRHRAAGAFQFGQKLVKVGQQFAQAGFVSVQAGARGHPLDAIAVMQAYGVVVQRHRLRPLGLALLPPAAEQGPVGINR